MREVVEVLKSLEQKPDYVTWVPNGEPTLDADLDKEAEGVKREVRVRLAILTNGSLLWRDDVRNDLTHFDLVSVKVDAASEDTWRAVNRPHDALRLDEIVDGLVDFSREFRGELISETMLVRGLNDSEREIEMIAEVLKEVRVRRAYISTPVRPPAESWVSPPDEEAIVRAYEIFSRKLGQDRVHLLTYLEHGEFVSLGDVEREIVNLLRVHPLALRHAIKLIERTGHNASRVISSLVEKRLVRIVEYQGEKFLVLRTRR